MTTKSQRARGLTLMEVLLVIATVFLLAAVALPMMVKPKGSPRIPCVNNLKQVGLASRLWANDNGDQFPQVSANPIGSLAWANSPQVFHHFLVMSNELVTPKILVCPFDSIRTKAVDFTSFSNANLSYFIALDADESKPQRLLSGDRNITGGTLSNGFLRTLASNTLAGWTTELHNKTGNIGLSDGSVQQVTEILLQRRLQDGDLPIIRLAIP
jgi:hypothetical protein